MGRQVSEEGTKESRRRGLLSMDFQRPRNHGTLEMLSNVLEKEEASRSFYPQPALKQGKFVRVSTELEKCSSLISRL